MMLPTTLRILTMFFLMIVPSLLSAQNDWARWRGPGGNGIAESTKPPVQWSSENNVVWKVKVPGRGHASPIVVDGKIFLATADKDKQSQSVVCFDQASGKQIWRSVANTGELSGRIHRKNTHASSTIAIHGENLFAVFCNHGKVRITALDFDGNEVWKKEVGMYEPKYPFGYGASPIVHGDNVIVTNENRADSAVVAFDAKTGDQRWKINRDGVTSYSTPVVTTINGQQQLLLSGGNKVVSYDPANGTKLWSIDASWEVTCGTMVWDGNMVYASGGYPNGQTLGIDAVSGKKIWENPAKVYEQSMITIDGYLYAHSDNGVIYCWRAKDGKEMWKQKFSSRRVPISASPVLANGNLYFTAENGETVVVRVNPEQYEEIGRNKLGDEAFASLAFCGNRIFARVGDNSSGSRQEWLYCLGKD